MDDEANLNPVPRVRRTAGRVLIGVGVLLLGVSAFAYGPVIWGWLGGPGQPVPGTFERDLPEGNFEIAIASFAAEPEDGGQPAGPTGKLDVLAVSVRDPNGSEVAVVVADLRTDLPVGVSYVEWASFRATSAGRYEFSIDTSRDAIVIVRRSLDDHKGIAMTSGLAGLLALAVGLFLAISRRSTPTDPPPPAAAARMMPPPDGA